MLELAGTKELLNDDHFTVDGTVVESWANLFQPKERSTCDDQNKPDD